MAGTGRLLRRLLEGSRLVVVPGAYDALTARLIARRGFPAVSMTGVGADVIFVVAPQTLEEVRSVPQRVDGPLRQRPGAAEPAGTVAE